MMIRISHSLLVIAIASTACGTWSYFQGAGPTIGHRTVQLDWPSSGVGELDVGRHQFVVTINNQDSNPHRILGITGGCGQVACFSSTALLPIGIAPNTAHQVAFNINVSMPGPFEIPIALYVDDNGLRVDEVTLHGIGRESGKSNASNPK
jgi:hypothetical protein